MLVNAFHPALEDAEIAFDGIGGDIAARIFVGAMFTVSRLAKCLSVPKYRLLSSVCRRLSWLMFSYAGFAF
jgi:hypothetical protein